MRDFSQAGLQLGWQLGGGHRGIVYSTKQWHLWHENGSGDVMILWFLLQRGSSTEGSCTIRYNKWKLFNSLWNWHFLQHCWDFVLVTTEVSNISLEGSLPILDNLLHKSTVSPRSPWASWTSRHLLQQSAFHVPHLEMPASSCLCLPLVVSAVCPLTPTPVLGLTLGSWTVLEKWLLLLFSVSLLGLLPHNLCPKVPLFSSSSQPSPQLVTFPRRRKGMKCDHHQFSHLNFPATVYLTSSFYLVCEKEIAPSLSPN